MTESFAKFLLRIGGWERVGEIAPEKHVILLEAPHTSIWDFWIGYLYCRSIGDKPRVMIKKESFFFPVKYILKAMGGFPMDRLHPAATIHGIVREMQESDKPFHLVICPEGTRAAVHKWKTGYHTIATQAGLPVYITFVDWGHKRVGIWGKAPLTGHAREDTDNIQQIYKSLNLIGKHPEKYLTE